MTTKSMLCSHISLIRPCSSSCTPRWCRCISKMEIGPEATYNPPRHSGRSHQCFEVLLDAPRPPLQLSKVLSDSARAFSGAPESTCSYGGGFRMLRDWTSRILKFWSYWDLCADLRETSREAETAARDTSRAAETAAHLCGRLGTLFWQQWFLHNDKAFRLIIFVFVTS